MKFMVFPDCFLPFYPKLESPKPPIVIPAPADNSYASKAPAGHWLGAETRENERWAFRRLS